LGEEKPAEHHRCSSNYSEAKGVKKYLSSADSRSIGFVPDPNVVEPLPVPLQDDACVVAKGQTCNLSVFVSRYWAESDNQVQNRQAMYGNLKVRATVRGTSYIAVAYEIYQGSTRVASGMTSTDVSWAQALRLLSGEYTIKFGNVSGYLTPGEVNFRVYGVPINGGSTTVETEVTAAYYSDRQSVPVVSEPSYGAIWTNAGYAVTASIFMSDYYSGTQTVIRQFVWNNPADSIVFIGNPAAGAEVAVEVLAFTPPKEAVFLSYSAKVVEVLQGVDAEGRTGRLIAQVGSGGGRNVALYDSVYAAIMAGAAQAQALTEIDVTKMIDATLSAMDVPSIGDVAIAGMIDSALAEMQAITGDLALPDILGELKAGLPEVAAISTDMPQLKVPELEMAVTKIQDLLAQNPGQMVSKLGKDGILPDIFLDFAFASVKNDSDKTVWMSCTFPNEFSQPPTVNATCEFRQGWVQDLKLTAPKLGKSALTQADIKKAFCLKAPVKPEDWAAGDALGGPYTHQSARVSIASQYGISFTNSVWTAKSGATMEASAYVANSGMWETEADWINRQALLSGPEAVLSLADPAVLQQKLQKEFEKKSSGLLADAKKQLEQKLTGKLGDWSFKIPIINKKIGLNGWRDAVLAVIIASCLALVLITQPLTLALMIILFIYLLTYVNQIAKIQNEIQKKLTQAQSKINAALKNASAQAGAAAAGLANEMNNMALTAMNTVNDQLTKQVETAINSIPDLIYQGSDLPAMKLPVVAVRNVSTSGCEVLVPAGATCHLWIIGKVGNPLGGYLPRAMSQMGATPDLRARLEEFLRSKRP
jgi:hypothetical protein